MFDGLANLVDLDYQGPANFLGASWSGFGGDTIAIADYYVSFGTNRRFPKLRANIVGVNRVERGKTSVLFEGLDLIPRGPKYYCTVVGEAGNRQRATTVCHLVRRGNIVRVGVFLDFVSPTTRAPHGVHVRGAERNRVDPHGGGIERVPLRCRTGSRSATGTRLSRGT